MNRNLFLTASLIAALVIPASAAFAADDGHVSVTVHYSDLDLQHSSGASAILSRVKSAARKACGPAISPITSLEQQAFYDACVKGSVERAIRRLDAPLVTAMYEGPSTTSVASAR